MILLTWPAFSRRGQTGVTVPGVVVDHGEVRGAVPAERVDQLHRLPGGTEAADQHGRAVLDRRRPLRRRRW